MRREPSLHNCTTHLVLSAVAVIHYSYSQRKDRSSVPAPLRPLPVRAIHVLWSGAFCAPVILISKYLPELGRSARRARGNGPARGFGRTQRYEGNSRPGAGLAFHFAGLLKSNRSRTVSRSVPAIRPTPQMSDRITRPAHRVEVYTRREQAPP
jgi:hypothetical protein